MGAALFIVLQREAKGVDASSVGGKFLSRNLEMLDELAKKLNVKALGDLISINPEEASEFLEGEGLSADGLSLPSEKWFEPGEGLRTVRALLRSQQSAQADPRLLEDLKSCEQVLMAAEQAGVNFHFAVDF